MILTSCFGKRNLKKSGLTPVAISLTVPKNFHGRRYTALAPTWEMIRLAHEWKKEEYTKIYQEQVLAWLDPKKVYEELDGSVLLTHDDFLPFSHRELVAEWLEKGTGNPVKEFGYDRD